MHGIRYWKGIFKWTRRALRLLSGRIKLLRGWGVKKKKKHCTIILYLLQANPSLSYTVNKIQMNARFTRLPSDYMQILHYCCIISAALVTDDAAALAELYLAVTNDQSLVITHTLLCCGGRVMNTCEN